MKKPHSCTFRDPAAAVQVTEPSIAPLLTRKKVLLRRTVCIYMARRPTHDESHIHLGFSLLMKSINLIKLINSLNEKYDM